MYRDDSNIYLCFIINHRQSLISLYSIELTFYVARKLSEFIHVQLLFSVVYFKKF